MKQNKICSNVDYHGIRDGRLTQFINCGKYDLDRDNWKSLEELFCRWNFDFVDLLFLKLTNRRPVERDKQLFSRTLMILSLGTGCHPPSVMVPKLIASTTKNRDFAVINGLIGGLAAMGTDHLGAVSGLMRMMVSIRERAGDSGLDEGVRQYLDEKFSKGEKIMGFGHPVYEKDPRPELLLKEIQRAGGTNAYLEVYELLREEIEARKRIYPNIDAVLALSYLVLGFEPEHGIYLSFISRSLSMVLHILEEVPKKPFAFLNEMVSLEDFSPGPMGAGQDMPGKMADKNGEL